MMFDRRGATVQVVLVLLVTISGAALGLKLAWRWSEPSSRSLEIKARQYAYEPSKIHASAGDTLKIRFASLDVVHGFYLEGHDVDVEIHPQQKEFLVRRPSQGKNWRESSELQVIVGGPGKYRYRCSHTCGSMHPFMLGEMIVSPNLPLHAGVGCLSGLFVGMLLSNFIRRRAPGPQLVSAVEGEADATIP